MGIGYRRSVLKRESEDCQCASLVGLANGFPTSQISLFLQDMDLIETCELLLAFYYPGFSGLQPQFWTETYFMLRAHVYHIGY